MVQDLIALGNAMNSHSISVKDEVSHAQKSMGQTSTPIYLPSKVMSLQSSRMKGEWGWVYGGQLYPSDLTMV